MEENKRWRTASEIAKHFGVKEPTIRIYTRLGMPCLRFSRTVRFDAAEVERWLRKRNDAKQAAKKEQLAA